MQQTTDRSATLLLIKVQTNGRTEARKINFLFSASTWMKSSPKLFCLRKVSKGVLCLVNWKKNWEELTLPSFQFAEHVMTRLHQRLDHEKSPNKESPKKKSPTIEKS